MKKIFTLFGLACMMLAIGCTKNDTVVNESVRTLAVTFDNETRTHLGTGEQSKTVLWSEGDKVVLSDKNEKSTTITVDSKYVGTSQAYFTIPAGYEAPYMVVYPAEAVENDQMSIAPEQTYTAGMFAEGRALMCGSTETAELQLKHLCSFLKITTSSPVEKVTITSSDMSYCSGLFDIDSDAASYSLVSVAGHYNTTMAKSGGAQEFIFAIPSQTYPAGFTATVYLANGTGDEKVAYKATGFEAKPGVMYSMPEITVAGGTDYNNYTIRDASTFVAYLTAVRAGDASAYQNSNGETFLGCDIDMTGVEVPANDTTLDSLFVGTFSGRDYKIKNWNSKGKALFTKVAYGSTVGDFIIDSSCSLEYPDTIEGPVAFAVIANNGLVRNIECKAAIAPWSGIMGQTTEGHIGVIAGDTKGTSTDSTAQIEGCINYSDISITLSTATATTTYLGGINGKGSYMYMCNCVNKGNITLTYTVTTVKNHYIGGVTGSSNDIGKGTSGCRNYGNLTVDLQEGAGAAVAMGGIVGYTPVGAKFCQNYGNITYDTHGKAIKGTMIAGIAAYSTMEIANCDNYGDVTVSGGPYVGRNSIGSYDGTKSTSTATTMVGGIIAGAAPYNATTFTASVTDCTNHGNVSWTLNNVTSTDAISKYGRHCIGGVAGDSAGPMTRCENNGDVSATIHSSDRQPLTPANAGYTIYLGGVAGACYYSKTQVQLQMDYCVNNGKVTFDSDIYYTTANSIGGIVGWPGTESSNNSERTFCENHGDVYATGQVVMRLGGVQGNSCPIHDCLNDGNVTLGKVDTAKKLLVGGVSGFHSGGYAFYNNTCKGTVTATEPSENTSVGGLFGFFGNSTLNVGEGCLVQADIEGNGCSTGAIIGGFNGMTKTINCTGVTIKNGTVVNGTTLTADNYNDYLHGTYQYTAGVHNISATFEN